MKYRFSIRRFIGIITVLGALLAPMVSHAVLLNAKDFGAKGDGETDDSVALQAALDAACKPGGGELLIPAGFYLVSKTLKLEKTALKLRGEGNAGYASTNNATTLTWVGEDGGTMMEAWGTSGLVFSDMMWRGLDYRNPEQKGKAGILFLARNVEGAGNTLNRFDNMSFHQAGVGMQMGKEVLEHTCSDYLLENITFARLDSGLKIINDQGVNFQCNFIFGLRCKTVFDLQCGGNIMVSNGANTECDTFVNIGGGGYCSGTFLFANCRVEWGDGGEKDGRTQVLRCYPKFCNALVKFINFNDAQHSGHKAEDKPWGKKPLFDLGPGSCVTVESSLFYGKYVATLKGVKGIDCNLTIRDSCLVQDSIKTADEYCHYRLVDCIGGFSTPLPTLDKWNVAAPKN